MNKKEHKSLKRYQRLAKAIHENFCDDPEWCNYGQKPPKEIRHSDDLGWAEVQRRADLRLKWYHHCQAAVDAENIAVRHT